MTTGMSIRTMLLSQDCRGYRRRSFGQPGRPSRWLWNPAGDRDVGKAILIGVRLYGGMYKMVRSQYATPLFGVMKMDRS
jgi:hypothetical protein